MDEVDSAAADDPEAEGDAGGIGPLAEFILNHICVTFDAIRKELNGTKLVCMEPSGNWARRVT